MMPSMPLLCLRNKRRCLMLSALLLCLSGCGIDEWLGDDSAKTAPLKGERIAIFSHQSELTPSAALSDAPFALPDPVSLSEFPSLMQAQQRGAANLRASGFTATQSSTIGDGESWQSTLVAAPVASDSTIFAMDAYGTVSAHDARDISTILWTSTTAADEDSAPMTGGGLAYGSGVVYATTASGAIVALVANDGSLLWRHETTMPIRSAPVVEGSQLYALTIDNQLLAFSARTGQPLWTHRGIREVAAYLGSAQPVVENGIVVVAYSSGELFALRAEDGSTLWSDSLVSSKNATASASVTGISATPLVHDNLVYAISNNGLMAASILSTGRGVWDVPISGTQTPWLAGDYLYVLTNDHQLLALHRGNRQIKWITPLIEAGGESAHFSAPMMVNGQLLLMHEDSEMLLINPQTGEILSRNSAPSGVFARPIVLHDALYMVDSSARLHRFE